MGQLIKLVFFLMFFLGNASLAQNLAPDCGSLENAYGPYDYTDPANTTNLGGQGVVPLHVVEGGHFNSDVENLIQGLSTAGPLPDLEYTLRAFPNHHRALYSMAKYHLRNGIKKHGTYTINCWFDRAIRFQPEDAVVRVVYGIFYAKAGNAENALEQYKKALDINDNMPEAHYNIGLLYAELENYDLAYEHAVRAYDLGYPLPGLKNRLSKVGFWK